MLSEPLTCRDLGHSAERIIKLMMGLADAYEIEDYGSRGSSARIAYFDNINRDESREMLNSIQEANSLESASGAHGPGHIVVMFATSMTDETIATLKTIDRCTDFVRISGHLYCSNREFWLLDQYKRRGLFRRTAEAIYEREAHRQMMQFGASAIEVKQCINKDRRYMLGLLEKKYNK